MSIFQPLEECTAMRSRLLKAAENDDICDLNLLLALNPNLLHDCAPMCDENPLHVACKHGSLEFFKTIIRLKPEFAGECDHYGFTPMHLASANGHTAMVVALAELDPKLCLIVDRDSKIPLHRAVMKGKEDVVRALIAACPESLRKVTYREETALHLALKYNQCGTFKVLMEELKKHKQEDLLDKKDHRGNTVLHIATSHKLIEILELLLSKNSTNGVMVQLNSVNNRGFTALDVHYQTSYDMVALEISHILHDAGAVEGQYSSHSHPRQQSSVHCPNNQIPASVVLAVLFMILEVGSAILSAYATASKSPIGPGDQAKFHIKNLILGPHRLPYVFYLMMFITVGFITTIGILLALVWYSPYRTVILFALVTVVVIPYGLMVDLAIPPFSVNLASCDIQSSLFMWLSAMALIIVAVAMWHIKAFLFICNKCVRKAMTGKAIEMVQQ